ncbi:MAG TPA: hypothetical protein VIX90_04605 [Edaphobacter sp.]
MTAPKLAPIASLLLALLCTPIGLAQQPIPIPQSNELHIAIRMQDESGEPISDLSTDRFQLTANGTSFPITVTRPGDRASATVPTRLLVLLTPTASRNNTDILERLHPFFKRGWQVSILTASSTQTPYAAREQDLKTALQNGIGKSKTVVQAIYDLDDFQGRRIVFYLTDSRQNLDDTTRKAAAKVTAMLYHVGGDIWRNFYGMPGSLALVTVTSDPASPLPDAPIYVQSIRDVREERTFAGARRDAIRDAQGYYDLKALIPDEVTAVTLGIKLKVNYCVNAQPYIEGHPAPDLILARTK